MRLIPRGVLSLPRPPVVMGWDFPFLYRVKARGEDAKPNGGMEEFTVRPGYLSAADADVYFGRCMKEVPFDKMRLDLVALPQLAYLYEQDRGKEPVGVLEELMAKVAEDFRCEVVSTWCNLFQHGDHHIDWHQDQYGCHTFVLSFGSPRKVLYRHKKSFFSKEQLISETLVSHGDLYYFAPTWDEKTEHSVPKMKDLKDPRVSLVFFTTRPFTRS